MSYYFEGGWPPYVPVAERRQKAQKALAALKKKDPACQPVQIEGRSIAKSFWGQAWCKHLETYSDYASRLPRGRSYVSHGAVIDLRIGAGEIEAKVLGSELYTVHIQVEPLAAKAWAALQKQCTGQIDSLIELLQGRFSKAVMALVTQPDTGLFPLSKQIKMRCSCPDGAWMCKHIAATLYGVGARLDHAPALLFQLRQVDPQALLTPTTALSAVPGKGDALAGTDLSALFGIELAANPVPVARPSTTALSKTKATASPPSRTAKNLRPSTRQRHPTFTASELLARGLPRHMIQLWLTSGVLLRTGTRGVYQSTAQTEARLASYLASRRIQKTPTSPSNKRPE